MILTKVLKDCVTGINGDDYDVGRVLWLAFGLGFLLFTAYGVWHDVHFDLSSFGINAGAILGGGGAGIGMKSKTEPDA
ncbi:hypothetical protein [Zavarzinella formosa]|uniref:hypothetical protein n=1 Tax=Zavarzinella formosa TaxID=360055 RepID=UPI00036AA628|nr:hypothetical protein [Zavarzinella formosa]